MAHRKTKPVLHGTRAPAPAVTANRKSAVSLVKAPHEKVSQGTGWGDSPKPNEDDSVPLPGLLATAKKEAVRARLSFLKKSHGVRKHPPKKESFRLSSRGLEIWRLQQSQLLDMDPTERAERRRELQERWDQIIGNTPAEGISGAAYQNDLCPRVQPAESIVEVRDAYVLLTKGMLALDRKHLGKLMDEEFKFATGLEKPPGNQHGNRDVRVLTQATTDYANFIIVSRQAEYRVSKEALRARRLQKPIGRSPLSNCSTVENDYTPASPGRSQRLKASAAPKSLTGASPDSAGHQRPAEHNTNGNGNPGPRPPMYQPFYDMPEEKLKLCWPSFVDASLSRNLDIDIDLPMISPAKAAALSS